MAEARKAGSECGCAEGGISIFAYSNYRKFLKDIYRARKADSPKFSHRFIQRELGVRSSGWFSDVLAGRTNLNRGHAACLARLLKLGPSEESYLLGLLDWSQAATSLERERILARLRAAKAEAEGRSSMASQPERYLLEKVGGLLGRASFQAEAENRVVLTLSRQEFEEACKELKNLRYLLAIAR